MGAVSTPDPTENEPGTSSWLNDAVSFILRRPVRVRVKTSPNNLVRGKLDVVILELNGLDVTGLDLDRVLIRAEGLRIDPGLPPRLRSDSLGFKGTVVQAAVDRWTRRTRLPVKLSLTPDGVVVKTGLRGISLSEVATELDITGPFLTLRPKRAAMLGVSTPVARFFRGYLPLPPMPMGAKLVRFEPGDGRMTAWFALEPLDEPLSPALAASLRKRFFPIPLTR
jgi:hypothetical protein